MWSCSPTSTQVLGVRANEGGGGSLYSGKQLGGTTENLKPVVRTTAHGLRGYGVGVGGQGPQPSPTSTRVPLQQSCTYRRFNLDSAIFAEMDLNLNPKP